MKIKSGFILRKVGDTNVVVAVGDRAEDFNGIITLNETGAFLWSKLVEEVTDNQLIEALLAEYDVEAKLAEQGVKDFLNTLRKGKLLDE